MYGHLVISGDATLVKKLLGMKDSFPGWGHVYDVNGLKLQACQIDVDHSWIDGVRMEVKLTTYIQKSQEEIAAEEAVRKAKESLKAAEKVLNKVKKEN